MDEPAVVAAEGRGLGANAARFSGFAGHYDAVRPTPPAELGALLARYRGRRPALVVDLGSGTGLSTRWAAAWADEVVGVEPSADMRAVAAAQAPGNARFVEGWAHATGLPSGSADVVLAVQALHWMEPESTLAEVSRVLAPGGVFAAVDCDWPPSLGSAPAEAAWAQCRSTVAAYGARAAAGLEGGALSSPLTEEERSRAAVGGGDPQRDRDRAQPGGARSWAKDGHLGRLATSGRFGWTTEVVMHQVVEGDAERFVQLLRSQGDYQALSRAGLDDDRLGVARFAERCHVALGPAPRPWVFTYRARLGVLADPPQ